MTKTGNSRPRSKSVGVANLHVHACVPPSTPVFTRASSRARARICAAPVVSAAAAAAAAAFHGRGDGGIPSGPGPPRHFRVPGR